MVCVCLPLAVIGFSASPHEPAPGYVGFEEGGQLTEAVRRRPYGKTLHSIMVVRVFSILTINPLVVIVLDEVRYS